MTHIRQITARSRWLTEETSVRCDWINGKTRRPFFVLVYLFLPSAEGRRSWPVKWQYSYKQGPCYGIAVGPETRRWRRREGCWLASWSFSCSPYWLKPCRVRNIFLWKVKYFRPPQIKHLGGLRETPWKFHTQSMFCFGRFVVLWHNRLCGIQKYRV